MPLGIELNLKLVVLFNGICCEKVAGYKFFTTLPARFGNTLDHFVKRFLAKPYVPKPPAMFIRKSSPNKA